MTLDEVVPHPQYRMCHARSISAPPTVVWDELGQVTMSALPLGYSLESIRLLPFTSTEVVFGVTGTDVTG